MTIKVFIFILLSKPILARSSKVFGAMFKMPDGTVHVEINVDSSSATNDVIATLPSGYRSGYDVAVAVDWSSAPSITDVLYIASGGAITAPSRSWQYYKHYMVFYADN